jgi:hypothetical protein
MRLELLQSLPGHCRAHGGREDGGQRDGDTQVRGSIPFNPKMHGLINFTDTKAFVGIS